ncbi:TPA: HEPN domain-containing protein [Candidatus Bathyarchaeota archaeon]|nr:HEPN domain-containing protein [Candidatus Bathyarchaeota archaeon]
MVTLGVGRREGGEGALRGPDVKRFILAYSEKARRRLDDAERLLRAGSFDSAVSQAYYAMFYVATALLAKGGGWPPPRKHAGLVSGFGLHIARRGMVDKELGQALSDMERLRREADYAVRAFTRGEAEKAVATARRFVRGLERS